MSRNSVDCMMVCKGCQIKLRRKQGVFVPPPEMTGTGVFYCSFKCWGKHRKRVNSHPCTNCVEMTYRTPKHITRSKTGRIFCSHECCVDYTRGPNHRRYSSIERKCRSCGKIMVVEKSRQRTQWLCSTKCRGKVLKGENHFKYQPRIRVPCPHCGKTVKIYKRDEGKQKYCSRSVPILLIPPA